MDQFQLVHSTMVSSSDYTTLNGSGKDVEEAVM
jgi:hypothetical protein